MSNNYELQQQIAIIDLLATEINVAMQRKEYCKVEQLLNKQLRAIKKIKANRNKSYYASKGG